MNEDEKVYDKQNISFSSINNCPSSKQDEQYSNNQNDSFLSVRQHSSKEIIQIRHIQMKSMNLSKRKNIKKNLDKELIESSSRDILENKKNEQRGNENFVVFNKKDEDKQSICKSEQTFVVLDNQMSSSVSEINRSEMKKVKKLIPEKNWFKNITYIIIILNTVQLILRTYPKKFWLICNIFDYIFTIFFIIEMSIKIKFFGFIKNANSYLRQTPFNILDFLITIGCSMNIILNIASNIKSSKSFPKIFEIKTNYSNLSEFRLFSLMIFPLEHRKIFFNVNFYLLNIKKMFVNLSNISIFIIFLFLFFSLIGLSFWRGRFSFFCHTQNQPINKNSFPLVELFQNNFCGGANKCNYRIDLCLSSKEFYKNGLLEKSVYEKEIDHEAFNYGITKFNNIFQSLLTIFIYSTGDGWDKIMSMTMDAHNYWISFVYFIIMESSFVLFIKNLILIIILLTFEKERELIKQNKVRDRITGEYSNHLLKNANSMKYIKKYCPIKKPDHLYMIKINKAINLATDNFKCKFCICNKNKTYNQKKFIISYIASIIYEQYITQIIFNTAIIFNIIIVLAEYIPGNDYITKKLSKEMLQIFVSIKLIIVIIYCLEQVLVLLINGPSLKLFTSFYYCIDFIFSILCVSIFFYEYNHNSSSEYRNPTIMFGIFRILKFYNPIYFKNRYFMMTVNSVMIVVRRTIYIIPIFLVFSISFSLLGYSLFHDSITFNEFGDYDENAKHNEINFKDFSNSLYSTFLILLQDDWVDLFYFCYRSEKNFVPFVLIFYVLIIIFGQIILMNMVLSFLFEQYHYTKERFENNYDTKNKMICMQLELTKYYQIDKLIHQKNRDYETIIKNLVMMNKRLVIGNKEMMLVGNSKIDLYKNIAKFNENFYLLHSNKLNKYHKEILVEDVFDNYFSERLDNMKKVKKTEFWHFNLNYTQAYSEKKHQHKRRKSVELNNLNRIFILKNNYIRQSNTIKLRESIDENMISSISKINKKNNLKSKKSLKIFDNKTLGKSISEKIDSKSFDYNMNILRKKTMRKLINARKLRSSNKFPINLLDEKDEIVINSKYKKIWHNLKNRSLFIFHRKNKFRVYIKNLTSLREFNYIITFLILVHTIVLWFDTPWVEKNSSQKHILDKFNFYLNIIFIIEGILKIIRFGFIIKEDYKINIKSNSNYFLANFIKYLDELNIQNFEEKTKKEQTKIVENFIISNKNNQAYLADPYNIIDFICIIISIIDMSNIIKNEGILLTALRAFRSIKPIRFINSSDELRFIMKVFMSSLVDIFSIIFMIIIYMIIISIIGQTLFRDKANYKCSLGLMYVNETDCVQNGGYWVHNPNNFSNFLNSFKNSFEIIMGENLGKIMEETYLLTNIYWTYPFFVIAAIIGNIFALKLLLAVIIQSFRKIQKHDDPYNNLTNPEKVWLKIQNEMSQYNPNMNIQFETKKNPHTKKFIKIISNKKFQKIYLILVIIDIILYMSKYEDASYIYLNIINYIKILVTILINVKVILNFMAYSFSSLNKKWHIFELIVTIVGDIALILDIIKNRLDDRNRDILTISQNLIEILNIARILRLLSLNNYFKETSTLFFSILPRLTSIIALLLIILMVYANLGTIIFGLLPYRTYINSNNNFGTSFNSLMMLFQVLTGSEWNMIMYEMAFHDCRNKSSIEYQSDYYCVFYNVTCFLKDSINHTFLYNFKEHRDQNDSNYFLNLDIRNNLNAYHLYCGSNGSYLYIISFIIICSILIMSLLVVFILDSYEKSYQIKENNKKSKFMNHILRIWHKYDATCRSLINPHDFVLLFKEIPPPFGLNYDRLISNNPLKYFKKRKEFLMFKNYLKNEQKNIDEEIIQFNDSKLKKNSDVLPNYYQFNNFYVDHNIKFFTDDIEMLKILNYFDLMSFIDKTGVSAKQANSYIFKNENLCDINFKNNYIHYIDTCLAISRLVASRFEGVDINSLRENFVNSYSCNKWMSNFNSNLVMEFFNLKDIPNTYKIINKLSYQILERTEKYYKIIQKKYLKNDNQENNLKKYGLILPTHQFRNDKKHKSEKTKVIKIFTRVTSRGSYILIPNNVITWKNNKSGNRKISDVDALKAIKKTFGKK